LGEDEIKKNNVIDSPAAVPEKNVDDDEEKKQEKNDDKTSTAAEEQPKAAPPSPDEENRRLQESLATAENRVKEAQERLLYQRAEFANYKKRVARDMKDHIDFATESLIIELLEPLDDFERAIAIKQGEGGKEPDPWREGVQASLKKLLNVLAGQGVEPFDSVGDTFDPHRHDALAMVDVPGVEPGIVVEELQRGYYMKGKVIRPAVVKVSQETSTSPAGGSMSHDDANTENVKKPNAQDDKTSKEIDENRG